MSRDTPIWAYKTTKESKEVATIKVRTLEKQATNIANWTYKWLEKVLSISKGAF